MTPNKFMKIIAFTLLFALSLTATACSGETPPPPTATAPETILATAEGGEASPLPEGELLPLTENWSSKGNQGTLNEVASCHIAILETKEDLDVYRPYLSDLSPEDEARILADKAGKCVLLEITSSEDNVFYSINSIYRGNNVIEISVNEEQSEETEPSHSFFLFYFSGEIYRGENIQALFLV
jgi:hypothetical protein